MLQCKEDELRRTLADLNAAKVCVSPMSSILYFPMISICPISLHVDRRS